MLSLCNTSPLIVTYCHVTTYPGVRRLLILSEWPRAGGAPRWYTEQQHLAEFLSELLTKDTVEYWISGRVDVTHRRD